MVTKTVAILILTGVAVAAAYVLFVIDKGSVNDYVAGQVCADLAAYSSTRPSSLEINRVQARSTDMTRRDAVVWKTMDGDISTAQKALLDMDYDDNRPFRETVISLDYSIELGARSARDLILCTFVDDNRNLTLKSILQGNSTVYRDDESDLTVMMASRLDLMWNVTELGVLDRLAYVGNQIGIN